MVGSGAVSVTATARLKKDYQKLMKDKIPYALAAPLHSNILEWHYAVIGAPGTPYEGGVYHGKLIFPADFPFKPPSIYMVTPSGRFQPNTRLCLSISDYHPDTWNPAWTVSTIITGLISFMNETSPTLGSITTSDAEKRSLAIRSRQFNLKNRHFCELFPELVADIRKQLAEEIAQQNAITTSTDSKTPPRSNERAAAAAEHSFTYNLVVLAGVVAIAFAVRYVILSSQDSP